MLRIKLKLYTYHTFLFVPFIVLFLYAHNIEVSQAEMTYRTIFIGTLFSLILYFIVQLFFRNRLKTGVFVSLFLFGLFQYGVLYEFINDIQVSGIWPFENVHRYLLIFYLIFFTLLLFYFKKTKYDFVRLNYFLNFLVLLLILFNGIKILLHPHSGFKFNSPPFVLSSSSIHFDSTQTKPDVYFIILDGYASNRTLKKFYSYDNSDFYKFLNSKGFRICDSAFSNYYSTTRSLCATLNMSYNDENKDALNGLRNNKLFSVLKSNGYSIYHLRSGFVVTRSFTEADSTVGIGGPNEFELSLLKHTALRLDDAFGFFAVRRLQSQFSKMYVMADISAKPKFCFLHFVAPHPPFVFEKNGTIRSKHFSDENLWEPEQHYLDQLAFVSFQIQKFISYLALKNPNAAILLQSDHGPYGSGKTVEDIFESRSQILYAYKAPSTVNIPNYTSSVNSFPYLLNGLFNTKIPILPDETPGKAAFLKNPLLNKKLED